jgi:hypothetical protein
MRLHSLLVASVIVYGAAPATLAQGQQPPQVASTVQLPTFSSFSVQTTVSVPDSGGAYLGGVNRGVDRTITRGFGPLRNRASTSSLGTSGESVHATIIDPAEMDRALLAEAASKRGVPLDPSATKAATLARTVGRSDGAAPPVESVAAIRQQNSSAADLQAAELAGYLTKAKQAEAEGKPGAARVFYQMVARRDAGQLRKEAVERLTALTAGTSQQR